MSADRDLLDLSGRIADLTPAKRALLRAKLQAKYVPNEHGRIPRRSADGPAPLSFGQHGIWLAEQIDPSVASNLLMVIRLTGPLDESSLSRSIRHIIERHEVLRTTFEFVSDRPVQIVHPSNDVKLPVTDLRDVPTDQREARCHEIAVDESRRPFDLQRGPLTRTHLVKLSETEHALLVPVHHIIFDGWSAGIFTMELANCYAAYREGWEPSLTELAIQYGDFAEWQQSFRPTPAPEQQLRYWKEQLGDRLPKLELPTDRRRPARVVHHGARELTLIPPQIVEKLKLLCQRQGVTMFMSLLAGLQILLGRYSGQDDIIVGSSIMKRNRAETRPLIGFFMSVLPLRTDLSGNPSFAALLQRVRETVSGAFAHSDLPYDRLVSTLKPVRGRSHNTLFQVEFQLLPPKEDPKEVAGLRVELVDSDPGVVWTDLDITVWEERRGLVIAAQYDSGLFEATTIRRFLEHHHALLEAIVDDPDAPIDRLPPLTPLERTSPAAGSTNQIQVSGNRLR